MNLLLIGNQVCYIRLVVALLNL